MCAAPAAGLTLDSLKQAPSAAVGASGAAPKDVRVVREWAGPVCRSRLVNDGPAPVRVREAVLFDVPHDHPAETRLYGEGFTMLSQTAGTLGKPADLGLTDRKHYRIPQPADATTVYGVLTLSPPLVRLKAICGPGDAGEPVISVLLPNED